MSAENKKKYNSNNQLWALWRQDDNGHKFLVSTRKTFLEAEHEKRSYESLGHKQLYWIEKY